MAILPENETYDFESRTYINPQVSLDEQNAFVDNLRNVQKTNNDQINMQTYNLGTAVPSSVGGLTGANSYFSSRYQTPQTNSLAANLRATAQAKALNDVLANEQAKMQKRYNDAYHASQIRQTNPTPTKDPEGEVDYNGQQTKTDLTGEQDKKGPYYTTTDVYEYPTTSSDRRSKQTTHDVRVVRDPSGNFVSIVIGGIPYYGREGRAKYNRYKQMGVVE